MGAGTIVFSALKAVGKWVAHNPAIVIDAADKAINLKPNALLARHCLLIAVASPVAEHGFKAVVCSFQYLQHVSSVVA